MTAKRSAGRPPHAPGGLDSALQSKVTAEEARRVDKAAGLSGLTVSAWLRQLVLLELERMALGGSSRVVVHLEPSTMVAAQRAAGRMAVSDWVRQLIVSQLEGDRAP